MNIAPASHDTALHVARRLDMTRPALDDLDTEDAALICYDTAAESICSWVVYAPDGQPAALFGADGAPGDDWGSAWMFSTPAVSTCSPLALVRAIRIAVEYALREHWPELRICGEERKPKENRFIRLLGFKDDGDGTMKATSS